MKKVLILLGVITAFTLVTACGIVPQTSFETETETTAERIIAEDEESTDSDKSIDSDEYSMFCGEDINAEYVLMSDVEEYVLGVKLYENGKEITYLYFINKEICKEGMKLTREDFLLENEYENSIAIFYNGELFLSPEIDTDSLPVIDVAFDEFNEEKSATIAVELSYVDNGEQKDFIGRSAVICRTAPENQQ